MSALIKTTGLIRKGQEFVGSSVVFPFQDELLCLTAGHNLYGQEFDREPVLSDWQVTDHQSVSHPVTALIGDKEFVAEHDIMLLKLNRQSDLTNFVCPKFCTIPKNPRHSLSFRGKYEASQNFVTQRHISYTELCPGTSHQFLCSIDRALLMNDSYASGSDWLKGWSGSGLFLEHPKDLICAGVMIEVPNMGNDGQLQFTSVSAIKALGIDLQLFDSSDLDYDQRLNETSLTAIFDAIDEKTVSEWENNDEHKPQLEFINNKLPKVYPEDKLAHNKQRIIKQLLVGKSYLTTELRKNEHLFNQYRSAYNVYNLEDKQFYVNSRREALCTLTQIKEVYEKYLDDTLGKNFSVPDIKLLAFYGVSEWIADCSLSFLADE